MSKLYSYTYSSLDGVIASPEKWVSPYFSNEMSEDLGQRLRSCAAMVLGRRTYTEFSQFWPTQGSEVPFADLNNNIRKYVVTETLAPAEWRNSSIVKLQDLEHLKSAGSLHITGSGTLIRSLLERGLIDEIIIMMCPVVLGSGQRHFEGAKATGLQLVSALPFPRGVMCLTYQREQ